MPACRSSTSSAPVAQATSGLGQGAAANRAAPDFRRQTLARCVLPARAGATTTTERCGQSGQRSTMSAAAWLDRLIRKSSASSAGRCGEIEDELIGRGGHALSLGGHGAAGAASLPL